MIDILLNQNCTIMNYNGETPKGPSYAIGYYSKCRIEKKRKIVQDKLGKPVVTYGKLFLPANDINKKLQIGAKISMQEPIQSPSEEYKIFSIEIYRGLSKDILMECVLW